MATKKSKATQETQTVETPTPNLTSETTALPNPEPIKPEQNSSLRKFLISLWNILRILAMLGAIAAALYFGWPWVNNNIVRPLQGNIADVQILQNRQSSSEINIAALQTQIAALQGQVNTLETQISAHTETLAKIEELQQTIRQNSEIDRAELDQQIKLLKSMELLSRARLFLYQSNFGLAKQDVQAAFDILSSLQADYPTAHPVMLQEVLFRLDLTLKNLPAFPVAASDDLDIAWQVLLGGLPPSPTSVLPTPSAEATTTPTP